jgi:hypothetical protein
MLPWQLTRKQAGLTQAVQQQQVVMQAVQLRVVQLRVGMEQHPWRPRPAEL